MKKAVKGFARFMGNWLYNCFKQVFYYSRWQGQHRFRKDNKLGIQVVCT